MLKCNVGTYNEGSFVHAYLKKFDGRPLIEEAEARDIMEVLIWLCESNTITAPTVIESDCLQAVHAIHSK
jgi:hypothetical protein